MTFCAKESNLRQVGAISHPSLSVGYVEQREQRETQT